MKKIITVEKLSKKYLLYHERERASETIREAVSNQCRSLWKTITRRNEKALKDSYEEFWALKELNFSVNEGDRLGVIGRNGAGKSTLLKILSRITVPTEGRIKINGRVSSLLEVGTGFHPDLTGRENIFLNGAILGMTHREIRKRFDEIVAFAEVEKFLDTPVKRFSSGMYTRLGFAIAAHLETDLLIVDEVLAVGDAQFQERCMKKMNEMGAKGRTILFVSHNVQAVLALCNKGLFLEKGEVKAFGSIEECVNSYSTSHPKGNLFWKGVIGDENVSLMKASLQPPQEEKNYFLHHEKTALKIEYELHKQCENFSIGFGIWNGRNQQLVRSKSRNEALLSPGKYAATFPIDANLFHEGEYFIKIDCISGHKKIPAEDILLRMPIYATKRDTPRLISNEREGVSLGNHWQVTKIE